MKCVGVDIGSRNIKVVVFKDGRFVESLCVETSARLKEQLKSLLGSMEFDELVATGYGRGLAEELFGAKTVTEIKAHALGVKKIFPEARTVLDIGGQDTKAISLDEDGKVLKFEMNDRCAAGTGRFLEVMARALGVELEELSEMALRASKAAPITSFCTVFAESEVVGLIAKGEPVEEIARGIIQSIVKRSVSLLKRVKVSGPVVFTGGVAQNKAVVKFLEEELKEEVLVPYDPRITGALGAAISATL